MFDWNGKTVVIIGAARQGIALARYLARRGARVRLTDQQPLEEFAEARRSLAELPIEWVCGGHPLSLLEGADLLCPSGGVPLELPLIVVARQRGIPLSNDSQIFLEDAPCKVIGITGSAGKTTTTTLVGRMAEAAINAHSQLLGCDIPHRVWVGGNIGSPLLSDLDEITPSSLAVMELSSFQLEIMTRSPQVAAILNITPNHLDRHGMMEAYTAAKAHILDFQTADDVAILGRDDPGAWGLVSRVRGEAGSFGREQPSPASVGTFVRGNGLFLQPRQAAEVEVMSLADIALRGEHNLANVLAACAIAYAAGLPPQAMRNGVVGFRGVAHRLEFVRSWGGADWYNDSIATAPERAMAAIRTFREPLVLLAGGRDKNLPWHDFAALAQQRVRQLILFGEAAQKIADACAAFSLETIRCADLHSALQRAARIVQPGDVVLLSPGGTSFDEFRDFEERGEVFRQWVMALP